MNILPKSCLGKSSIALIFLMPVLFYVGVSFVSFYKPGSAGSTILNDIVARPGVAVPMLAGFLSGICAFGSGIISIVSKKDCSVSVYVSTIAGFLVSLWILAEILFTH